MLQRSVLLRCLAAASTTPGPHTSGQLGSISITVKDARHPEAEISLTWPPLPQPPFSSSPAGKPSTAAPSTTATSSFDLADASNAAYTSTPRSPYSILRGRRTVMNRCAVGALHGRGVVRQANPTTTSTSSNTHSSSSTSSSSPFTVDGSCGAWCCCSALLYPTAPFSPASQPADDDAGLRDAFLLALRVSKSESTLRNILGEAGFTELVGTSLATAGHTVALCADPTPVFKAASAASGTDSSAPRDWTARTLLSADEESRIEWLWEENGDLRACYARAPTLRALFIMWSLTNANRSDGAGEEASFGASGPPPTVAAIEQVHQRMRTHNVTPSMCDVAALVAFAEATEPSSRHVVMRLVLRLVKPETVANPGPASTTTAAGQQRTTLGLIMVLASLCRFAHRLRDARQERLRVAAAAAAYHDTDPGADNDSADRPSHRELTSEEEDHFLLLVRVATRMGDSQAMLEKAMSAAPTIELKGNAQGNAGGSGDGRATPPPHAAAMLRLIEAFTSEIREVATDTELSPNSAHLSEVTVWLLKTMPRSPVCYRHYQLVVDHSPNDAILLLERSGLLGKRYVDLHTINRIVLPLVEHCGNEDFFTLVMRDVIGLLEDRLHRDPHSFTDGDMKRIAELGARLCAGPTASVDGSGIPATGSGSAGFDSAAREQMEELHVMDGSPWALCVSSYRSLREIVQNLVRDNRRLKRQVQEQMRNIATGVTGAGDGLLRGIGGQDTTASTSAIANTSPLSSSTVDDVSSVSAAGAVGSGGGGEDAFKRGGVPQGPPSTDSTAAETPAASHTNTATTTTAAATAGQRLSSTSRLMTSPVVRQRFLVFVEDLVKGLVDESSAHTGRPIVVSSELFAFINRHVPVPNIQDEYRRKIFLLVNVAEDPETLRKRRREHRRQKRLAAQRKREEGEERWRQRQMEGTPDGKSGAQSEWDRAFSGKRAPVESYGQRWGLLSRISGGGASRRNGAGAGEEADDEDEDDWDPGDGLDGDLHGGAEEIPAELRFLVSSLPLTLSPWAGVMILREVLAESAGRNPRYTYVLNAAIDLQLPISTTRSRIATTLNTWRFLNTQAHKLSLKESVVMKQRCVFNLPLSYILSSYWSLLTWTVVASIVMLNVVGLDFESQLVANSLFQKFTPWEEVIDVAMEPWNADAAADLASDYFEQDEIATKHRPSARRSSDMILSSASYLFLGYDDQRRPMTLIPISSDPHLSEDERAAEEFAGAAAVLRELSLHAPFPFYLDLERPMSVESVETRVAERIRRVSFNNAWFLPRMIIRTFPLGRQYTERMLISHTCSQANLTRRRITFLIYVDDSVAVTRQFLRGLQESVLAQSANLVLVVHERSLAKGCTTPHGVDSLAATVVHDADVNEEDASSSFKRREEALRVLPYCRQLHEIREGFSCGMHKTDSKGGHRGGSLPGSAMLQDFSPFSRYFGLRIPATGEDNDKRRRTGAQPATERSAISAILNDSMSVMVGATAAVVNLAVMPFRYAWRATGRCVGMRPVSGGGDGNPDESGAAVPAAASARPAWGGAARGEMGLPRSRRKRPESPATATGPASYSASHATAGTGESAGVAADGCTTPSAHPRKVIAVPFSMVQEATRMMAVTGQSAMRWLADSAADGCAGGKSLAPGTPLTAMDSLPNLTVIANAALNNNSDSGLKPARDHGWR